MMNSGIDALADQFASTSRFLEGNTIALNELLQALEALRRHLLETESQKQPEIIRRDQVIVEVKCTFMKIWDIDTLTQKYEAEVFIQAKWQEPQITQIYTDYDPKYFWNPKLIIMNVAGDLAVNRKSYSITYESGYNYPVVIQYWMIKGRFAENLELQHFPFDVQDITIQVSSERSINEVKIIEDKRMMSTVNMKCLDAQEWSIFKHVECFEDTSTTDYTTMFEHPVLYIQCRASRKVGYFMWNIMGIVLMIMLLTFATLAIDPNIPDRMVITITLFLTLVAFKLVVKSNLPTISYLTYLDIYILASLVFLGIQTAESAIMDALTRIWTMDEVIAYDQYIMMAIAINLLMFHIIFSIYIYLTAFNRRRLMREKDVIYFKKRAYLHQHGRMMSSNTFIVPNEKTALIDDF